MTTKVTEHTASPCRYAARAGAIFLALLAAHCGGRGKEADTANVKPLEPELPMHYLIRLPRDYDRTHEYQLVIGLHGFQKTEDQFTWMWDEGLLYKPDFILVGVRAPFRSNEGYTWFGSGPGEPAPTGKRNIAAALTDEQRVLEVLADVEEKHRIDPESRIVMGLSQGASIAHFVVLRNPDLFSGLADFGGRVLPGILPEVTEENAGHLNVFIGMGREEGSVALDPARASADKFRKAGARVEFDLHDEGHVIKAAQVRAMENFFELGAETAPLDDFVYSEGSSPGAPAEPDEPPPDYEDEVYDDEGVDGE